MIRNRMIFFGLFFIGLVFAPGSVAYGGEIEAESLPNTPIQHVIVLIQNNHSFDNYFGTYPGVDGIPATACVPVNPFELDNPSCILPYHLADNPIEDLDHSTSTFFQQYNGGRLNGFIHALNMKNQDGKIALGYYDDRDIPYYWNIADEYVLFDRFFSSAHGGSVWNRMFAVAAVPGYEKNRIPARGFNDIQTIFDRLEERGVSWKFYVSNYDPGLTYRDLGEGELLNPQVQWVPLLSFDRFIDNPDLFNKIVDINEYYQDLAQGTLPSISYVLALGATEHPLSNLESGQRFVRNMLQALMVSEAWSSTAFIITYDDWGGWYDHVPPPQIDEFGYGFRVPAMLVSPYAKQGYVDSTELDFTSILKFIEENWAIEPLSERDARANSIAGAFDFTRPPRDARFIPWARQAEVKIAEPNRVMIYSTYGASLVLTCLLIWLASRGFEFRPRRASSKGAPVVERKEIG